MEAAMKAMKRTSCAVVLVLVAVQALASAQVDRPKALKFDGALVKRHASGESKTGMGRTPSGIVFVNVTLKTLLQSAFALHDFQVVGGPAWLSTDRFDVIAKAAQGSTYTRADINQMFQQLLIERFKLVHRLETKPMPIYALTMVKPGVLGERLRRNSIDCASPDTPAAIRQDPKQCAMRFGYSTVDSQGRTLNYLTEAITPHVGRLIEDRTGLTGPFDFSVQWNRVGKPGSPDPSLFVAFQEQLGLQLEPATGPVEMLTIQNAEHPTPD
jgi:uncharacterized protein (TIGR03435 family)